MLKVPIKLFEILLRRDGMTNLKLLKFYDLMLCFTLVMPLCGYTTNSIADINSDLESATSSGNVTEAGRLLANGADINATNRRNGITPLYAAVLSGHKDVVEFLVAKGADVNAKSNDGYTSLHAAAADGYKDVVALLIAKGADVNARNNDGVPPLFWPP